MGCFSVVLRLCLEKDNVYSINVKNGLSEESDNLLHYFMPSMKGSLKNSPDLVHIYLILHECLQNTDCSCYQIT